MSNANKFLNLEWWVYMFMVLGFFGSCMIFNYIVKKVNEAKLEERFLRMRQKASTTQSTQVHGPLIEMETNKGLPENTQPTPVGISLVFNQEDNKRCQDLEETFNIIKNTLGTRKYEARSLSLSLKTDISLEAVQPAIQSAVQSATINTVITSTPNPKPVEKKCDCRMSNNSMQKSESAKKSFLEIPFIDSKVNPIEKSKDDPSGNSFIKKTVDSIVSKIAGTSIHEDVQSEKTLTDWIKDLLVPLVLDEDSIILKPSNHSSKK